MADDADIDDLEGTHNVIALTHIITELEKIALNQKGLYTMNLLLAEGFLNDAAVPPSARSSIVSGMHHMVAHFEGEDARRIYLDAQTGGDYSLQRALKDAGVDDTVARVFKSSLKGGSN